MSTRLPRPTNWRISPFNTPQSLTAPVQAPPPSRSPRRPPSQDPTPVEYTRHRLALKKSFPNGWSPPKRLSRDNMDNLRMLHAHSPETFTTPVLAERFKISPEAVRRILKSKWVPTRERREELRLRDEAKRAEKRRGRVQKEWNEGVDRGALKVKERPDEDGLELT